MFLVWKTKMNRFFITLLTLIGLSIACSVQTKGPPNAFLTPTPNASVTPTAIPTKTLTAPTVPNAWEADVILPLVNVRNSPNGSSIGVVQAGETVEILSCVGSWCKIKNPSGYIYRGCLSDNPDGLKCLSK
jgi:hypothetical protein